jgi:hypothetical protein
MKKKDNKGENLMFNRIKGKFLFVSSISDSIPYYSRQLLRQHKAKLHKRAKEIQEQLVCDIYHFLFYFFIFRNSI